MLALSPAYLAVLRFMRTNGDPYPHRFPNGWRFIWAPTPLGTVECCLNGTLVPITVAETYTVQSHTVLVLINGQIMDDDGPFIELMNQEERSLRIEKRKQRAHIESMIYGTEERAAL